MKNKYTYVLLLLFLYLGLQAQAQRITAYQTKIEQLSSHQAEELEELLRSAYTNKWVNYDELNHLEYDIALVEVIDMKWDGITRLTFSPAVVNRLQGLKYIYLRSYSFLNDGVVRRNFESLLQQLHGLENEVEIIYSTMEQPN